MGKKYVVCGDTQFYPWVWKYDSLEKAEKEYEKIEPFDESVFLCEVIKSKTGTEKL